MDMDDSDWILVMVLVAVFLGFGLLIWHFEVRLAARDVRCRSVGGHLIQVDRSHLCVRAGLILEGY